MEGVDYMQYKRVEDDLKPHNQETIKNVLKFFETSNKCCAIQATGTGKTFLILRLLEIYNDVGKKAIIFAPNREIIKQTRKKMVTYNLNNATFYTYQKLARMIDDEISNIKVDLIVCDELHRTGAKTWGKKFEYIVDTHPEAKVFGVTATPLRCVDGRDMADEYFGGNRACNISLAEAFVREIIPVMPIYVSALYTFEEEYQNISRKINNSNNSAEEKAKFQKELLIAKRQLEKANGVPEIIKKYIRNYNGKYLVFCKDKKHLYAMKDIVIGWFREAGYRGKIFEYPYFSNNSAVRRNLENFQNNGEEGLKLLFVIDKLNEGLHLEEVHGCILLRTTVSNIIYYQQIGRAIDAGSNEQRVILDLVSNFDSLKSLNFKKELEQKIIERRKGRFSDCSEKIDLKKFCVVDCVHECIEIFDSIENSLIDGWNIRMQALNKYYLREGHSNVPIRHIEEIDGNNINLGLFVYHIRNGGYKLTEREKNQLETVQFIYKKVHEQRWDIFLEALNNYKSEYGDCDVPVKYTTLIGDVEINLGEAVSEIRKRNKKGELDNEKISELNNIEFIWDVDEYRFYKHIDEVNKYCLKHQCNVWEIKSSKHNKYEKRLYSFIHSEREKLLNGEYGDAESRKRVDALARIGIEKSTLGNKHEIKWEIMLNGYVEAYSRYGNRIPDDYVVPHGGNLRHWIYRQKRNKKQGQLSDKKICQLEKSGLVFD